MSQLQQRQSTCAMTDCLSRVDELQGAVRGDQKRKRRVQIISPSFGQTNRKQASKLNTHLVESVPGLNKIRKSIGAVAVEGLVSFLSDSGFRDFSQVQPPSALSLSFSAQLGNRPRPITKRASTALGLIPWQFMCGSLCCLQLPLISLLNRWSQAFPTSYNPFLKETLEV